jgi:hypothetical protein
LKFGPGVGRGIGFGSGQARSDGWQKEGCRFRLGVSPLGGGGGAAAIMVAATGVADYKLFGFRAQRILAVMNSPAQAADTRRGRRSRERQWEKISHEREEQ